MAYTLHFTKINYFSKGFKEKNETTAFSRMTEAINVTALSNSIISKAEGSVVQTIAIIYRCIKVHVLKSFIISLL